MTHVGNVRFAANLDDLGGGRLMAIDFRMDQRANRTSRMSLAELHPLHRRATPDFTERSYTWEWRK